MNLASKFRLHGHVVPQLRNHVHQVWCWV